MDVVNDIVKVVTSEQHISTLKKLGMSSIYYRRRRFVVVRCCCWTLFLCENRNRHESYDDVGNQMDPVV